MTNLFPPLSPVMLYFAFWPLAQLLGLLDLEAPVPALPKLFLQFIGLNLLQSALFYWLHRLFHHRLLYRFHKKHHEFRTTYAFAADYMSPVCSIYTPCFRR